MFEDFEWNAEVNITSEAVNKAEMATTLNSMLNFLARKQGQPLTPDERSIEPMMKAIRKLLGWIMGLKN